MTHWWISNNPLLKFAPLLLVVTLIAIFFVRNEVFTYVCFVLFSVYLILAIAFTADSVEKIRQSADAFSKKSVIEEYILLRPYKGVDESTWEDMWKEITVKVNSTVAEQGIKDYVYKEDDVRKLLRSAIDDFKTKFNNYKNIDVDSIVEWDRVLFIATQMYNQDVNTYYENKFSSAIWKDYANKELASIINKPQEGSSC